MCFAFLQLVSPLSFVAYCKRPKVIGKGKLDPKKRKYEQGEYVEVKCSSGYMPDGAHTSVCADEKFNFPKLKCKKGRCCLAVYRWLSYSLK